MKFLTATVFGLMLSSRIFGAVADEFRCELKIADESTQVMVGSASFEASPIRKMSLDLPPTTISNIPISYKNEKIEVYAQLGFTFQMRSGVEKATYSGQHSVTVCTKGNGTCSSVLIFNPEVEVLIVNGIPVFPSTESSLNAKEDGYEIRMDCRHTQTYP